nr:hypothetical protein [Lachnospiraceae bacterium]
MKNTYEYHASQCHVNGKKKAIKIRKIVALLCLFLGMMGIAGISREYEIGFTENEEGRTTWAKELGKKLFWPVLEVYAEEEEEEEDTDPNHIYLLDGRLMVVDIGSGASENIGYYSQWAGKRVAWYGD